MKITCGDAARETSAGGRTFDKGERHVGGLTRPSRHGLGIKDVREKSRTNVLSQKAGCQD